MYIKLVGCHLRVLHCCHVFNRWLTNRTWIHDVYDLSHMPDVRYLAPVGHEWSALNPKWKYIYQTSHIENYHDESVIISLIYKSKSLQDSEVCGTMSQLAHKLAHLPCYQFYTVKKYRVIKRSLCTWWLQYRKRCTETFWSLCIICGWSSVA
jgi:hypothetical protein